MSTAVEVKTPTTVAAFAEWCEQAPAGTTLDPRQVARMLRDIAGRPESPSEPPVSEPTAVAPTWRALLWSVPAETRIGRAELLEALDRSPSWLYARVRHGHPDPIPCRKDPSGELVFIAGEIRQWWTAREQVVHPGHMARADLEASCTLRIAR